MFIKVDLAMTFSERNAIFKIGIAICAISTLLITAASFQVLPAYQTMNDDVLRPAGILHVIISHILNNNYIAVHVSVILAVLYSLIGTCLIHYFFEQTSAPEILYISFFTISLTFEIIRLNLPLYSIYNIPSFYLLITSRFLLFARYFGMFSLFAASMCAAGLEAQKAGIIILIIVIAALVITFSVPINTQNWDTSLNMVNGYISMFRLIETIAFLSTIISFLIAVNVHGSKDYAYIGLGVMIALIGRNLLINADNWVCSVMGILLLSTGTWFICTKLHNIHLWL
ncbi:MAG: hypothetical protein FWC03_08425 [Treponema sp.]|nr:hypothetical protein [Treponema sp.]